MDSVRLQAKFLVVSPTQVLHPAQMIIRHGRVVEVTRAVAAKADIDLGDSVLLPGLLNAHTHLEFSSLEQPFPAGASFPDWISQVVSYRREREAAAVHSAGSVEADIATAIRKGLVESFFRGSVLVGDIVSQPWQTSWLPTVAELGRTARSLGAFLQVANSAATRILASRKGLEWTEHFRPICFPQVVAFPELIGLQGDRVRESCAWAGSLHPGRSCELLNSLGASPHAPYSTNLPYARKCLAKLPAHQLVAMHVAESRDELEWLAHGTGAFRDAFLRLGVPVDLPRASIEECISLLAARKALLIHGNYLTKAQLEQVAAAKSMAVVYCPRTHSHFGHDSYPLDLLRAARIRVVLGTDSRASNPDLSLWDEVVHVRQRYDRISDVELLSSVTNSSARALGVEKDLGSLEIGKWASAIVIPARADWTETNLLSRLTQISSAELQMWPLGYLGQAVGSAQ